MAGSDSARRAGANPYVGPRPFETGERLYGRDREVRELYYLLSAERVVVLHSPSGAGKSSLVQAGLIPRLRRRFDVWRPTRVNQEPENGEANRYVLSALQGFEEGIPEELRRPLGTLAGQTLAEYVAARPRRPSAPEGVLLVFDQFEEVLTVDPLAVEVKREFFAEVGELLHDPRVWALFALREDFLAPLDPYVSEVPTHFRNRFRIDLLDLEAAREAIVHPARKGGREFPAAGDLIHDLATMKVQRSDGTFREETGRHVEPVQLQVVCRRLWDEMPADDPSIDRDDLKRFGDVTESLAAYYADSVAKAAAGAPARERAVREWFSGELIAAGGVRAQVLHGVEISGGLANELIARLLDAHLVRAEKRAGATWYELAHDRLIEPVVKDNARWRQEHLAPAQRRAALWESQNRPAGLLLGDAELADAERWAATHGDQVTETEGRFLDASREARAAAERERRQERRIRRLAAGATVTSVLALAALGFAIRSYLEVRGEARRALSRQLAAQSSQLLDAHLDRALLLTLEAGRVAPTLEARQALLAAVQHNPRLWRFLHGRQGPVESVALSPDGRTLAAAADGSLLLWDVESGRVRSRLRLPETLQPVVAYSAGGQWLAAGGVDRGNPVRGRLDLWDVTDVTDEPRPRRAPDPGGRVNDLAFCGPGESAALAWVTKNDVLLWRPAEGAKPRALQRGVPVRRLAFTADCACLAVAHDRDGGIDLLAADARGSSGCPASALRGPRGEVRGLAFSPGSDVLAVAREDAIELWAPESESYETLSGVGESVHQVVFHPDGTLAGATGGGAVVLWDPPGVDRLTGHDGPVHTLAFNDDGSLLASAGADGKAILWRLGATQRLARVLEGHGDEVWSVAFGPEGRRLASAGKDTTVRLWDLATGRGSELPGNTGETQGLAFSADGTRVAAGGRDGTLHLWRPGEAVEAIHWRTPNRRPVRSAVFSPDGATLASAVDDEILLWDLESDPPEPKTLATHGGDVWGLLFRDGGATLAASDTRGQVVFWQVATGQERGRLSPRGEPENQILSALAGSPDGAFLAAASRDPEDRCVYLWEMAGDELPDCLPGHPHPVLTVAFGRRGALLFSGDTGGELIVWDVASRREIGRLRGGHAEGEAINSLSVSADGRILASGADDHDVTLWDLDWRAAACAVARRNLSVDEQRTYLRLEPRPGLCPDEQQEVVLEDER